MDKPDFVANFQMGGYCIKKIQLQNPFPVLPVENIERKIKFGYAIKESRFDESRNAMVGIADLSVQLVIEAPNDVEFLCEIELEGLFTGEDISAEEFDDMLNVNGNAALYSIARANIASITSLAFNDGKIMLPMVNFTKISFPDSDEAPAEPKDN